MLQITNKTLAKLLQNKYVYYLVIALSAINIAKYLKSGNVYCLLSFIGIHLLSNKFVTKSMTLSLIFALLAASFLLGCGSIIEGLQPGNGNLEDTPPVNPCTKLSGKEKKECEKVLIAPKRAPSVK